MAEQRTDNDWGRLREIQNDRFNIFPRAFEGDCSGSTEDIEDWLLEVAAIAEANQWSEHDKRLKVPAFLRGNALRWYANCKGSISTWEQFEEAIRAEFRPSDWKEQQKTEFEQLRQEPREKVANFTRRFRMTACKLTDITDEEKRRKFVKALHPHIRKWVAFGEPTTLEQAFKLAKLGKMSCVAKDFNQLQDLKPSVSKLAEEVAIDSVDALADKVANLVIQRVDSRHRPANTAQIPNDTCYNCNERGHYSRECPKPPKARRDHLKGTGLVRGVNQLPKTNRQ